METTNLREADAILTAQGVLTEKNLEVTTESGVKKIKGNLVLKITDTDTISVGVNVASKKSDGHGGYTNDDNKNFASIETVMNEYKSIAEFGDEEADIIRITNGKIRPYYGVKNDRETMSYSSNFFNRVNKNADNNDNYAKFEIEAYIKSVTPEVYTNGENAGMPTGRTVVKGWLPTYNGIEPIEFIAPEEDDIANAVAENYGPGMTVRFYGDIINRRIKKTQTIPVKIGKPKVTTTYDFTNEMVITGASESYADDDALTAKAFDGGAVKLAIAERDERIEELKQKEKSGAKSTGTSFQNKPASSGRKLPF